MLIARSRKIVWRAAARELEASGQSILTWNVLAHLVRTGPSAQGDLANAIAQHPAGVSRLVEELDGEGLVARRRDTRDRRRVYVEATTRGRARFEAMFPSVVSAVEQALLPLSVAERKQLRNLLTKLVAQDQPE